MQADVTGKLTNGQHQPVPIRNVLVLGNRAHPPAEAEQRAVVGRVAREGWEPPAWELPAWVWVALRCLPWAVLVWS